MAGFSIRKNILYLHKTKRRVLVKFLIVALIFVVYLAIVSFKYGIEQGILISLLSWSFFVFCTPIADAGFLVDFPVRMLIGIRMIFSEAIVWGVAAVLNIYALLTRPALYDKTFLLKFFRQILLNPIPYWIIIVLSATGTFLSVYFGDELIDVIRNEDREKYHAHRFKYYIILLLFVIFVATLFLYETLLNKLGVHIPIF